MTKEFKHIPEKKNNMFTKNMNIRLTNEELDELHRMTCELISSEELNVTKYITQQMILRYIVFRTQLYNIRK